MLKFQEEYSIVHQSFEDFILVIFVLVDDLYKNCAREHQTSSQCRQSSFKRLGDNHNCLVRRNYRSRFRKRVVFLSQEKFPPSFSKNV